MLKSRSKLHTHDDGKRDRERDGVRCSVLVGDDIPQERHHHPKEEKEVEAKQHHPTEKR